MLQKQKNGDLLFLGRDNGGSRSCDNLNIASFISHVATEIGCKSPALHSTICSLISLAKAACTRFTQAQTRSFSYRELQYTHPNSQQYVGSLI